MKLNTNKGFTLIELLVVISVISLLSSIVLASFRTANAKAKVARLFEDQHSIQNSFDIIRDTKNSVLGAINGDWCNECDFNKTKTVKSQKSPMQQNDAAFKALGFPSGAPLDPWGNPYLLDANEAESPDPADCGRYDGAYSAGPNSLYESHNFLVNFVPALPGVVNGANDDYLLFFSLFKCTSAVAPG